MDKNFMKSVIDFKNQDSSKRKYGETFKLLLPALSDIESLSEEELEESVKCLSHITAQLIRYARDDYADTIKSGAYNFHGYERWQEDWDYKMALYKKIMDELQAIKEKHKLTNDCNDLY
jgi:hypothetical protein